MEDPAHAAAYDQAALADQDLDSSVFPGLAAVPRQDPKQAAAPPRIASGRLRFGFASALAALFALIAFVWQPLAEASPGDFVVTAAGEHRTVNLADGSSVALNGNSRVWLASANGREAELVRGEALFNIRHNPQRPFVVRLGKDRIQDLGTVFNVVRDHRTLKVEVVEGAVRFRRGGNGLQLKAGQTMVISPAGDAIVGRKHPSAIAAWRARKLVYEGEPVSEVASELGRNLGVSISVAPSLASQQFTGSVHFAGSARNVVPQFASAIDAKARKTRGRWVIERDPGSPRRINHPDRATDGPATNLAVSGPGAAEEAWR